MRSFSLTSTKKLHTSEIYGKLAQADPQRCCFVNHCQQQPELSNSQSWNTSKHFITQLSWQPDSRSRLSGQKLRTTSELTSPPSRKPFMNQENQDAPQSSRRQTNKQTIKNRQPDPLDRNIWCAVHRLQPASEWRSCEVIKLQEEPLSGQISVGFQHESVWSSRCCCTGNAQQAADVMCRGSLGGEKRFWSLAAYRALLSPQYLGQGPQ